MTGPAGESAGSSAGRGGMPPCEVCGGTAVDGDGYCTGCRRYRGRVAPATALTTFVPRSYEVVAPPAGRPGAADPVTSRPPPGGPGGARPAVPPGPVGPARPGRSLLIPLVVLSATVVVIVAAIVVVGVLRSGRGTPVVTATAGSAVPPPAGQVDPCVVGTWRQLSMRADVAFDQVGTVTFTGAGATLLLRPDGTGELTYPAGTAYRGDVRGFGYELVLTGSMSFRYRAVDGALTRTAVAPSGTAVVRINGAVATSQPLAADLEPARYTCSGDSLIEQTASRRAEYRRAGG